MLNGIFSNKFYESCLLIEEKVSSQKEIDRRRFINEFILTKEPFRNELNEKIADFSVFLEHVDYWDGDFYCTIIKVHALFENEDDKIHFKLKYD